MRLVIAVLVRDAEVIAIASNYHAPCLREGYQTGKGYDLCEGCQYQNHAEVKALPKAKRGDRIYLTGHTYVCDICRVACDEARVDVAIL